MNVRNDTWFFFKSLHLHFLSCRVFITSTHLVPFVKCVPIININISPEQIQRLTDSVHRIKDHGTLHPFYPRPQINICTFYKIFSSFPFQMLFPKSPIHSPCLVPQLTHSNFLALAFTCTGAYSLLKTKGLTCQWWPMRPSSATYAARDTSSRGTG